MFFVTWVHSIKNKFMNRLRSQNTMLQNWSAVVLNQLSKILRQFSFFCADIIKLWTLLKVRHYILKVLFRNVDITLVQSFLIRLEQRQYKNDSTQSKIFLVLKLPRFFTSHIGNWKARRFQESFLTELSRSYIVFALI